LQGGQPAFCCVNVGEGIGVFRVEREDVLGLLEGEIPVADCDCCIGFV